MRGAVVRRDLIRVELAGPPGGLFGDFQVRDRPGRAGPSGIFQVFGLGPAQEILGNGSANVAAVAEIAMELPILAAHRVPERQVLRIERAFGDDRIRAHERPAGAVGRLEGVQAALAAADPQRLVACLRRTLRVRVLER